MKHTEIKDFLIKGNSFFFRDNSTDSAVIHENFVKLTEWSYNFPKDDTIKRIFDIGANIGAVSVKMANLYPEAEILSFEPVKDNFELLQMNTFKYPKITPLRCALSGKDGETEIFCSDDEWNNGGFSLFEAGANTARTEKITLQKADSFGTADLIKIDTEGSEYEILRNLDISKTKYILGELHGEKDYELFAYLRDAGFDLAFKKHIDTRIFMFYAINRMKTIHG